MPPRRRRPDLDAPFSLPDDTDMDDVLRKLLEGDAEGVEDVSEDPEEGEDG